MKVWYKLPTNNDDDVTNNKPKPILLMHGIGIYLLPYIPFIKSILAKNPKQAIICIEIPWITVTATNYLGYGSSYIKHKLPSDTTDFVLIMSEMEKMLMERQNIYHQHINNQLIQLEWTLIGHSYGTFIISGIYKYCKNNENEDVIIPRLVLVDQYRYVHHIQQQQHYLQNQHQIGQHMHYNYLLFKNYKFHALSRY